MHGSWNPTWIFIPPDASSRSRVQATGDSRSPCNVVSSGMLAPYPTVTPFKMHPDPILAPAPISEFLTIESRPMLTSSST